MIAMASISSGTSRLTIKSLDFVSVSSHSSSLRTQFLSAPNLSSNALRCRTTPKNVAVRAMSSGPQLELTVKNTIAQNPVVVYSKTWCSYSSQVKSLFKKLGVEPFVIELDLLGSEGAQLQKTLEKVSGQRTVPNVFIGGKHIGGCSDTVELHQKGELESLLSEAGATTPKS